VPQTGTPEMKSAGAVDRIDDPVEGAGRDLSVPFLADDAVIGKARAQHGADGDFGVPWFGPRSPDQSPSPIYFSTARLVRKPASVLAAAGVGRLQHGPLHEIWIEAAQGPGCSWTDALPRRLSFLCKSHSSDAASQERHFCWWASDSFMQQMLSCAC